MEEILNVMFVLHGLLQCPQQYHHLHLHTLQLYFDSLRLHSIAGERPILLVKFAQEPVQKLDTALPLQRSESDFAGTNAKVQLALLYVSGFRDQDATLRTALQLLRRKYRLIEHTLATVVRSTIFERSWVPSLCRNVEKIIAARP